MQLRGRSSPRSLVLPTCLDACLQTLIDSKQGIGLSLATFVFFSRGIKFPFPCDSIGPFPVELRLCRDSVTQASSNISFQ